jgi:hypothetical protein
MGKVKYRYNRWVVIVWVASLSIVYAIPIISNPSHPQQWEYLAIVGSFLVLVLFNYFFGTYGQIDKKNGTVSRIDYFLSPKRLNLRDVSAVRYGATWVFGDDYGQSLYIIAEVAGIKTAIEFSNLGWSERVLAKMAGDLKQAYPSIQFDDHADALIKKYGHSS